VRKKDSNKVRKNLRNEQKIKLGEKNNFKCYITIDLQGFSKRRKKKTL